MAMIDKEKLLQIVRQKGPVLPVALTSELKGNILLASAVLSEFVSEKKLHISNTKIGGSPVYYLPEQRPLLQNLYKYLNEKDKKSFDLLKEHKVLRHTDLDPLTRVSLSNIKDFAVPLEVLYHDQKEIFWKWYLAADDEVKEKIHTYLTQPETPLPQPIPQQASVEAVVPVASTVVSASSTTQTLATPLQSVALEVSLVPSVKVTSPIIPSTPPTIAVPEQKENKKELKPERRKQIKPVQRKEKEKQKPLREKQQPLPKPVQVTPLIPSPETVKNASNPPVLNDPFAVKLVNFFKHYNLCVIEGSVKKKNTELEYHVNLPTAIGTIEHICIAYNKKRCMEADIINAFAQGQIKKLPVLVLVTGDVAAKAQAKANEYKNLKIMKVGL